MKLRILAVAQSLAILLLAAALLAHYVSFDKSRPVVRDAAAPGESTLSYTPPAAPRVPAETLLQMARLREMRTPKVERITDSIYNASGFALGSVQMVVTDEGLVIVDSTESREAAHEIRERFREIADKPVRYLVYTHGHLDHIRGAAVFLEPGTQVVATEDLVRFVRKDFELLGDFHKRCRLNQAGMLAPEYSRRLRVKPLFRWEQDPGEFVRPTVTFAEEVSFVLGGKRFELYHTTGETPDHLMIWLPDEKALFCGDLYYASFPNLSTPMLEPRPVQGWAESLDRMALLEPEFLVPGHTPAILGRQEVREALTSHARAIRTVFEQTVQCINQGKTVEEAAALVKLPADLAGKPRLRELYGRVDWSVRGIYQGLTGWYDGRGTGLAPLPPGHRAREIVNLCGGPDRILARAIELQRAGEHQLVCELCDVVIAANPAERVARVVKAASLETLAFTSGNLNMFGFYRSAAALERQAAGR